MCKKQTIYKNSIFVRIFRNFALGFEYRCMYINSDFSRLEISLKGCLENYRYFRSKLDDSTKLLVLVKANAYGHGAVQFASLMEDAGADYLAVAYPVEGIELRQAGIKSPVMVLTAGTDSFEQIINYGLEPGIPNMYSLKVLCGVLKKRGMTDFPVHIKLDTGMHRLGFMTEELQELQDFMKECNCVKIRSVYSHLAASDDPTSDDFTLSQVELFKQNADRLTESLGYKPMYHILNSAGIERFPEYLMISIVIQSILCNTSRISGTINHHIFYFGMRTQIFVIHTTDNQPRNSKSHECKQTYKQQPYVSRIVG